MGRRVREKEIIFFSQRERERERESIYIYIYIYICSLSLPYIYIYIYIYICARACVDHLFFFFCWNCPPMMARRFFFFCSRKWRWSCYFMGKGKKRHDALRGARARARARVVRYMSGVADKTIILTDSSKFQKQALLTNSPLRKSTE
ncbi:hypothetical protein ABG752_00030 [Streptococcus iniae]